jgi:hypothetical protein
MSAEPSSDGSTVRVRVPMVIRRRGGRRLVITPDGEPTLAARRPTIDNTLLTALVKAFYWRRQLDEGAYATISELATANRLNISYVAHVLRLTLLAPDLVEAILDGTQPATMQLQPLMRDMPADWSEQRRRLSTPSATRTVCAPRPDACRARGDRRFG